MYSIELAPAAVRQLRALPRDAQRRIGRKIDSLADDPRPRGAVALRGARGIYRLRAGSYRIIYEVRDEKLLVLVIRIAHRKDVYRGLSGRGGG